MQLRTGRRSLDVLPGFTANYAVGLGPRKAYLTCERRNRVTSSVFFSNLSNCMKRELAGGNTRTARGLFWFRVPPVPGAAGYFFWMSMGAVSRARCRTPFLVSVLDIVSMGAQKQVCRVYTKGVVTLMTDTHVGWDRTVRQLVSHSVGAYLPSRASKPTVSLHGAADPPPAGWPLLDFFPETVGHRPRRTPYLNRSRNCCTSFIVRTTRVNGRLFPS